MNARILQLLLDTPRDRGVALIRIALALVILPHGAQKLLGWFGGAGLEGTIQYFGAALGVPALLAGLVIAGEFFGGLALLTGAFGRVAAASIGGIMIGAVALVHWSNGFFMNWAGSQAGEGFEYHILAIAMAALVAVKGSGAWSLDRRLARTLVEPQAQSGPVGRESRAA